MPYDSFGFEDLEVPASKPFDFDTAKPDERLLELARLLENEQEWRDILIAWDYRYVERQTSASCGTAGCALGLAKYSWPRVKFGDWDHDSTVYDAFGMNADDMELIFYGGFLGDSADSAAFSRVEPGHVATAIREFVSKRNAPPQDA